MSQCSNGITNAKLIHNVLSINTGIKMALTKDLIIIQKSKIDDVQLIKDLLSKEDLPVSGVEDHIDNFLSLSINGVLIGAVGLEIYDDKALLRSLVVDKLHQSNGYGKRLCSEIIQKARHQNISEVYLLTETAPKYFENIGFKIIRRESADEMIKTSEEFQTLCPSTAVCMFLVLN